VEAPRTDEQPAEASKLTATRPAPSAEALELQSKVVIKLQVPQESQGLQPKVASTLPSTTASPQPVQGATPPMALLPPSIPVAQVEGGLRWMLKTGAQEAQLQLHPEALGQVTIHLRVEGGEVHARLWVLEPASVQVIQDGRSHLEQSLKDQGLQLGSFDLHQGRRPFQDSTPAPVFSPSAVQPAEPTRQEAPTAPAPSILNPHRIELYA
jgi:flagellar hook-length control protein FliK